jgi:transcriptional regulator with XRE-family HTH domain
MYDVYMPESAQQWQSCDDDAAFLARAQWDLTGGRADADARPGAPERSTAPATRRPLEAWESPLLHALGRELRELRLQAGLTQATAAWRAQLGERSLRRIEAGQRRTRSSTLQRLLQAFEVVDVDLALQGLLAVAGAALAPESGHPARIAVRRARRHRKAARRFVTEHTVVYVDQPDGLLAVHRHRRRVGRTGTVERNYQVLHPCAGQQRYLPAEEALWSRPLPPT